MDQELVQYLGEQFGGINRRFEQVDQRFEQIDRQFAEIRREISDRSEETKRHTGVLVEDLRHQVQLVAEGFAVFVDGRYAQDQANIDRRFDETNALIRSLYAQINQRFENIERKSQR
jgi:archaellum component FlaC